MQRYLDVDDFGTGERPFVNRAREAADREAVALEKLCH
jgi:hypothetical protein